MAQTTFTIRMDADTKRDFGALCANIGLTMSAAIGIFAKKAVAERRIPFDLTANADPNDPFFSPEHLAELESRYEDVKAGRNVQAHELIEAEGGRVALVATAKTRIIKCDTEEE